MGHYDAAITPVDRMVKICNGIFRAVHCYADIDCKQKYILRLFCIIFKAGITLQERWMYSLNCLRPLMSQVWITCEMIKIQIFPLKNVVPEKKSKHIIILHLTQKALVIPTSASLMIKINPQEQVMHDNCVDIFILEHPSHTHRHAFECSATHTVCALIIIPPDHLFACVFSEHVSSHS